ncbi:hypothetical protein M472_16080 [Sphingobacterium paucimobilis HER1398]|uniref:Uncharacterized protein n=1 Tax=Sphingobacterium paucimobilis HER1398 TaxID=1346330 RepID=U2H7Y7_9SPHI|nr:hypothetical protein M472_03510 [Sphingobacterium paucimobilis HER1398]ERJ60277.1 hypothetical protein M472_16080 [Sphingobacterium paucimobilis HER1398]
MPNQLRFSKTELGECFQDMPNYKFFIDFKHLIIKSAKAHKNLY